MSNTQKYAKYICYCFYLCVIPHYVRYKDNLGINVRKTRRGKQQCTINPEPLSTSNKQNTGQRQTYKTEKKIQRNTYLNKCAPRTLSKIRGCFQVIAKGKQFLSMLRHLPEILC